VDKVTSLSSGKVYARKRINKKWSWGDDKSAQTTYDRELKALSAVNRRHEHLIRICGTYSDKKYFALLLLPVAETDLKKYMDGGGPQIPEERNRFRSFFGCLLSTVSFLHDVQLLHKDIKPENILLKNGEPVLTDFGTAFDWSQSGQSMTRSNRKDVVTPRYQSPEVASCGEFHRSSDIWSLGVVFLDMVTILLGQSRSQMDEYLRSKFTKMIEIHANTNAAIHWLEELQKGYRGDKVDCEPLVWIPEMLSRLPANRPSAVDLYHKTLSFQDGKIFCGRCCREFDDDSSDSSEASTEETAVDVRDFRVFSENLLGEDGINRSIDPQSRISIPGEFPCDEAAIVQHIVQQSDFGTEFSMFGTSTRIYPTTPDSSLIDYSPEPGQPAASGPIRAQSPQLDMSSPDRKKYSRSHRKVSSLDKDSSLKVDNPGSSAETKAQRVRARSSNNKQKAGSFLERDIYIRWLASLPSKLAFRPQLLRSRSKDVEHHRMRQGLSIEEKRMEHFLTSLPEEGDLYDDQVDTERPPSDPTQMLPRRSNTSPDFTHTGIKRSSSQNDLHETAASSALLQDESDQDHFTSANPRLVHYPSDGNLREAAENSSESFVEVIRRFKRVAPIDLRCMAISNCHTEQSPEYGLTAVRSSPPPPTEQGPVELRADVQDFPGDDAILIPLRESLPHVLAILPSLLGPQDNLREMSGQPPLQSATQIPPTPQPSSMVSSEESKASTNNSPLISKNETSKCAQPSSESTLVSSDKPLSLGKFIAQVPKTRPKRNRESATIIMERTLANKASVAPTTVMSANTRAMISPSSPLMRWNDHCYDYLCHFVTRGGVAAVRTLLSQGCNPGTAKRPRRPPVLRAIQGETDKHIKCLWALVSYGTDMKAITPSNGRTYLHYAIERKPWSGYSTAIYILLMMGTDPNKRDYCNDLPLLMLLTGAGVLPDAKRDALYLLLAPNFETKLDVKVPASMDNPLHLSVRHKDAYATDAILAKMKESGETQILDACNGSGFSPLLLAFTIFSLRNDADDELDIVRSLLEAGSNPNAQDETKGDTPLHLAIRGKMSVALELLCKHKANATIKNKSDLSVTQEIRKLRLAHQLDKWYTWAARRMGSRLTDSDFIPEEVVAWLAEDPVTAPSTTAGIAGLPPGIKS
jgi:serine/threonine protein kinase